MGWFVLIMWLLGLGAIVSLGVLAAELNKPRRSISEICDDAIKDTINKELPKMIGAIFREEIKKPEYAPFRFVKVIQWHIQQAQPDLADKQAYEMARRAYATFLSDEKITFGDKRYAWDRAAAKTIAHEYEIDHWERAA